VTTQASHPATFPCCSRAVCRFAAHTSLAPHAAVKKDNRSYKGRQPKASHALKEEEQAELLQIQQEEIQQKTRTDDDDPIPDLYTKFTREKKKKKKKKQGLLLLLVRSHKKKKRSRVQTSTK